MHLMGTAQGQPVECFLTPGSDRDLQALQALQCDVPARRSIDAAKAYHDEGMADLLQESCNMELRPLRQKNATRVTPPYRAFVQHDHRQRIDTAGSLLERVWPNTLHAVTARGFEWNVFRLVLA
jgi:hypothetical protein